MATFHYCPKEEADPSIKGWITVEGSTAGEAIERLPTSAQKRVKKEWARLKEELKDDGTYTGETFEDCMGAVAGGFRGFTFMNEDDWECAMANTAFEPDPNEHSKCCDNPANHRVDVEPYEFNRCVICSKCGQMLCWFKIDASGNVTASKPTMGNEKFSVQIASV